MKNLKSLELENSDKFFSKNDTVIILFKNFLSIAAEIKAGFIDECENSLFHRGSMSLIPASAQCGSAVHGAFNKTFSLYPFFIDIFENCTFIK